MKKLIIIVLSICLINCFTPNFFHYSKKWTIVENIINECVYESSLSKNDDLILLYDLNQDKTKKVIINNRNFHISKKSILLEIYWSKGIPENFSQIINSKLGSNDIINTFFYIDESPWTRLNDSTLISDYISNLDLYSDSSKTSGSLKKYKSLVIFNYSTDDDYEKITRFLRDEFNIYRKIKYNSCVN